MYRIKPILSFVTIAAFIVAFTAVDAEAGDLAGKKLLVDTAYGMVPAGDKVNDGLNTIRPSMTMIGDTVNVELFIEEGGGAKVVGGEVKFEVEDGGDMMFDDSWQLVDVSSIIPAAPGISPKLSDNGVSLLSLAPNEIPENGYFASVKIVALANIQAGSSFKVASAVLLVGASVQSADSDFLNVDDAIVTVAEPQGPSIMGMGDGLAGTMIQIPAAEGGSASITVALENLPEDPSISYTVSTSGDGELSVLDPDGMMLELDDMMMVTADKIVLKVTGGSLQVTVKATVNGEDTAPVTFTFTQLNPAELASFDGALQSDRVVLNWSTVSQTNNAGWRITRSVDGETFEAVGNFVQGAGTSDALMNYTFEDTNPPGVEKVYYRLEQVDLDGSISQSNVIEVLLGARMPLPTEFAVNVYPNPFNPSTTISYELPESAPVSVVIYDVLGQQVRHLISQVNSAGRYSVQWDARDNQGRGVASGVYIAKVDAGTTTLSQKMLLLK